MFSNDLLRQSPDCSAVPDSRVTRWVQRRAAPGTGRFFSTFQPILPEPPSAPGPVHPSLTTTTTITMIAPTLSRSAARAALRASSRSAAPVAQPAARAFSLLAKATPAAAPRAAAAVPAIHQRGVKTLDFAGTKEKVYERADWPLERLHEYFKDDTLALLGYGSQGHGQGLK